MPAKIVSDLHSAVSALRREVSSSDTLLLLGDLVNIIDYRSLTGILVDVYGEEVVGRVVSFRAERRYDEARALMAAERDGREDEVRAAFDGAMARAYAEVAGALPERTYVIGGNIDPPRMLDGLVRPGLGLPDGKVVEIEGLGVGFVGGGLPTPAKVAGEVSEEEFAAKLDGLGDVDVVCTHMPPDIPELTFDTVAQRRERGSAHLVDYIRRVRPRRAYFGHIHQPLVSSAHIGPTQCINAGFFRYSGRAWPLSF